MSLLQRKRWTLLIFVGLISLSLPNILECTRPIIRVFDGPERTASDSYRNKLKEVEDEDLKRPERITVLAPRQLRPNSDYHVLVNLANSQQPANFEISITGARDSDREQTDAKSLLVQSGETQTVNFKIGDWQAAEYILSVRAEAVDRSWNFSKDQDLVYQAKSFTGLIQTDKPIYKAGDLIQLRAIFLSPPNLTPLMLKNEINVTISDAKRTIVKQWNSLSNWRGLLSLDLQLSQEPVLGVWQIKVEAKNQEFKKTFRVAEYVLPHFEVSIQLPKYVTYNDSEMVAHVKAAYTYGKPVKGNVVLTVQPLLRLVNLEAHPLDPVQYSAKLDDSGNADFSIDLAKKVKKLIANEKNELFERQVEFFALVEEDLTGRKYNKTEVLTIYNKEIKIDVINKNRNFKPGLEHLTLLKISYQDDTPVENMGPELELRYLAYGKLIESVMLRPVAGQASHLVTIPKKVSRSLLAEDIFPVNSVDLQAHYRNQIHYLGAIQAYRSASEQYMQIYLPQLNTKFGRSPKSVTVDDELEILVKSTEMMQQVNCQGIARGDIVFAISREPGNATEFNFSIKIDAKMVPEMSIICFYIRPENKEMIVDSAVVQVSSMSKNIVKLSVSREEAKPGQEVEVGIFTKPNSLVGLLAIDQSVTLLGSASNDISPQDLREEMNLYGGSSKALDSGSQAINAQSLLGEEDIVVLTNNLIYGEYGYNVGEQLVALSITKEKVKTLPRDSIGLAPYILDYKFQPPDYHPEAKTVVRTEFPETWLWLNGTANAEGSAIFKARAPDTITSWMMSAFSLSESAGFGLAPSSRTLRVFRPFFIKLHLPYSIMRGETLSVQAVIFNYSKRKTSARITLHNQADQFDFVEAANRVEDERRNSQESETRLIVIPPEDGISVSFLITPKRLGYIDIKVTAQSEFATDGLVQKLLVKPEGQTQYFNKAMLVSIPNPGTPISRNFSIMVPANAVNGSQKVFVTLVGDLMGPGLSNVDDLLRLPYGCGEQNMINLVPNIVILNYLRSSGRLRELQRSRAIRNIEAGYQRQLNFRRRDGSFSAFGQSDANGSVWLTAYVLRTFQQARDLITVDDRVIRQAAHFIAFHSRSNGNIDEVGMLHNKQLQSAAANKPTGKSIYLTAYAMIALLQRPIDPDGESPAPVALDEVLDRGLEYLVRHMEQQEEELSTYELAIITYTLQLAKGREQSASSAYRSLWARVRENNDLMWWADENLSNESSEPRVIDDQLEREFETFANRTKASASSSDKTRQTKLEQSAHLFVPDALSVEMTAWALLSCVQRNDLERALPIVRWLVEQQNSQGGFASTQDTVLAIEALGAFASASKMPASAMTIDIEYARPFSSPNSIRHNENIHEQLEVSRSNALLSQQIRMPDNATWIQVQASGSGVAVVQVSWQYNLLVSAEEPAFYLNPIIDSSSSINYLQLSVCTYFKAGNTSNMALMEVDLPSGYTADLEALPGLRLQPNIKRVDAAQGGSKVFIYLDRVTHDDETCLTIPAHRTSKVSNNRPVPVTIYDYYDRRRAARIFYEPQPASSCDICEQDTCHEQCGSKPKREPKFVPLHEQRQMNLKNGRLIQQKFANLTLDESGRPYVPASNSSQQILPLAPVLMTIMAAARNLYEQR